MKNRNVIVFIVEGITDKDSLYGILSELYEDKNIVFSIVGGDITTDKSTSVKNIDSKVVSYIKKAIERDKFNKSDITRIVHLIDTDGAYIPDEKIIYNDIDKPYYSEKNIETRNIEYMKTRNQQKRNILNKLSTMNTIFKGIKYNVYYMSCNLEHVLHNIQNANEAQKKYLAESLEDKFFDNPEEFVNFISTASFSVHGNYTETWEYIKQGTNSLNRYSNFSLFFND